MKLKKKYIDINDTLKGIKIQILDSVNYTRENIPRFENPEQAFEWCKQNTSYKNDPKNIELLQSVQTLFENNYHSIPGAGDCDCYSILCGAICIVNKWKFDIVLVGRDSRSPVHIYNLIYFKGDPYIFDLTNPKFNYERPYPLIQELPCNWRKWTKKRI